MEKQAPEHLEIADSFYDYILQAVMSTLELDLKVLCICERPRVEEKDPAP